jgi:flagellar biosynthesis protein FliP
VLVILAAALMDGCAPDSQLSAPGYVLGRIAGNPSEVSTGVHLLVLLTVLSLAPAF